MSADRHRFFLDVEAACWPRLWVMCPYHPADETRPCWPHETETDDNAPLPAPQTICTYEDWIYAADPEDILHGVIEVEVKGVVVWEDGFQFHMESVATDVERAS